MKILLEVKESCQLYVLVTCGFSKAVFEQIILQYPNVGLQVIKNMSERISQLTSRVGTMATTSIEEILYNVPLHVAGQHGIVRENGQMIQFPLTHEELSFLIGAHRVSITRGMKYLKETGKVSENIIFLVVAARELSTAEA